MFINKNRLENVRRVLARNTRAANVYSFVCERYHNVKYKNSPYYMGSVLWDNLLILKRQCLNTLDYRKYLKRIYCKYKDNIL